MSRVSGNEAVLIWYVPPQEKLRQSEVPLKLSGKIL